MKIPKNLKKGNKQYKLIKIYPNFALYENIKTKTKETFSKYDLGLIEEAETPRNISPEKVTYL
ncbi:MAG TPA: hypothetical protein IAC20_04040 [Candidatus Faecisoma merdavium]|nr:hypothetical protein [Candidatus Faecisoma merdavium]